MTFPPQAQLAALEVEQAALIERLRGDVLTLRKAVVRARNDLREALSMNAGFTNEHGRKAYTKEALEKLVAALAAVPAAASVKDGRYVGIIDHGPVTPPQAEAVAEMLDKFNSDWELFEPTPERPWIKDARLDLTNAILRLLAAQIAVSEAADAGSIPAGRAMIREAAVRIVMESAEAVRANPKKYKLAGGIARRLEEVLAAAEQQRQRDVETIKTLRKSLGEMTTRWYGDREAGIPSAAQREIALHELVVQIGKCNPIDDHGHDFKLNKAYCDAVELLSDRS